MPDPGPNEQPTVRGPRGGRAFATYNVLRALLLVLALGIGWLAGLRGLILIVAGLAVSGIVSLFLLKRQAIAMGEAVEHTIARSRERLAARSASEDATADEIHARARAVDQASTTHLTH
ncbi:MAG TPA: hypothetical protein VMH41_12215 [Mycobacteriales bacterium]|nr:hypothetical protein [Mycobacteriales bacterium]